MIMISLAILFYVFSLQQLHVTTRDGKPALNKRIKLKISSDGRKLKEITEVVQDGLMTFNINPPENAKTLSLRVRYLISFSEVLAS